MHHLLYLSRYAPLFQTPVCCHLLCAKDVGSVVSSQHGLINRGMPASTSISPNPCTQQENEDTGAAITTQRCFFDTICIDAVCFAGLLSVF